MKEVIAGLELGRDYIAALTLKKKDHSISISHAGSVSYPPNTPKKELPDFIRKLWKEFHIPTIPFVLV